MRLEKYTYLITALHVLHRVPKGATYDETLQALEERFRDQHLDVAHRCQLKMRTQGVRESLQEFGTAVKQLAHLHYLRTT